MIFIARHFWELKIQILFCMNWLFMNVLPCTHTNSNTDTNFDPNTDTNSNKHSNSYSYANSYANSDMDSNTDSNFTPTDTLPKRRRIHQR